MPLKLDKFTWGILVVVALLLVGAFATVSLADGGSRGDETLTYVDEDSPTATVRNAYVAFLRNEPLEARKFYSEDVLDEAEQSRGFPDQFGGYYPSDRNQRLRILDADVDEDAGTAAVTIAVDHYNRGGPFNSGSTWTNQQVLPLVREEGAWKIDTLYLFY